MTLDLTALAARLTAETFAPSPSPSPSDVLRPGLDPYDVSPGLLGFLAIFAVAGVCVVGWMSLNRKVRRLRFAERAEGRVAPGTEADGDGTPGDAAGPSSAAGPSDAVEPTTRASED